MAGYEGIATPEVGNDYASAGAVADPQAPSPDITKAVDSVNARVAEARQPAEGQPQNTSVFDRNKQWAIPGAYITKLDAADEMRFQQWVKRNNVPFDLNQKTPQDYDMRGFYQAIQSGDPIAKEALNPNDNRMHFPDKWKTPYHKSFSNESMYATGNAPRWVNDHQLADQSGQILFDERAPQPKAQQPAEGQPQEAMNLSDAIDAGWQVSTAGLVKRGKNPDTILPEHAPMMFKIAAGLTTLAGDVPAMLAGIGMASPLEAGGAEAGAVVGAPFGPVGAAVGATVGGAIPAGAAALALPSWMRAGLMDYYAKGGQRSDDYVSALASSFLSKHALGEGLKGAVTGAATAGLGAPVRAVSPLLGAGTELATMTTVSAALNGKMPTADDFVQAAATLAVMHAGSAVLSRAPELTQTSAAWLRENFANTGESPHEAAARIAADPVARQSMFEDVKVRDQTEGYTYDAYHGTTADIAAFDPIMRGANTTAGAAKGAFFFSDDPSTASTYAVEPGKAGANVMPVRLKLENPLVIDMKGQFGGGATMDFTLKQAQAQGNDGVIFHNIRDAIQGPQTPSTVYAIFDPKQIRGRFGGVNEAAAPVEPAVTPELARLRAGNKPAVEAPPANGSEPAQAAQPTEAAPPQTPKEKILSRIGEPAKASYTMDDFRYDFINDLQYANAAVRDALAGTGKTLDTYKNPAEQLRLAYGAHGWAENILQRDLKPIVQPIMKSGQWEDFVSYMVSKRVLEKEQQGIATGFDIQAAHEEVVRGEQTGNFQTAAKQINDYQNAWLDRAEKAGVLSADQRAAYKEFNADYVPFNRVMDDVPPANGKGGQGFRVRNPAKEMTGSEKPILNPFDSIVKNSYVWAQMIRNNEALTRLADFSESLPQDRQFLAPAARTLNATELSETDANLSRFLSDQGIDPSEANGVMVYRAAQKVLDKNQILIFKDGKPTVFEASDPNLMKSLTKLDQTTYNSLTKILRVPAAAFRAGTTLVPEFLAKNVIRDQLSGFIQNTYKTVPFLDFATGFKALLTNPEAVDQWAESGGMNSALLSMDTDIFQKDFFALDKSQALPTQQVWNAVKTPFRLLQSAGMMAENATRLGQFLRAQEEGIPDIEAAMRSRDISLDFYRMGARVRALNAIGSFLGPQINGLDRLGQAFTEDPMGATMRAMAAVTLPSVILWWSHHDQDWYRQQPQWLKDTTWMFKVGDVIMRIPKSPIYGTLFGTIPERILEQYVQHNPDAWHQIGSQIWQDFNPVEAGVPVVLSPIAEIASNWNFFTNQPLVSSSMEESYLPQYRYSDYTSETAKQLSKLIPEFVPDRFRTPIAIDHLVKSWTGGTGSYITQIADQGLYAAGVAPRPNRPTTPLAQLPVIKAFTVMNPSANTDAIEKFYERTGQAYQTMGTYKMLMQQGKDDEAQKLLEGGRDFLKLGQMHEAMANMRHTVRSITENDQMTPDEKRQLIDNVYGAMNQLAEAGVATLDAAK